MVNRMPPGARLSSGGDAPPDRSSSGLIAGSVVGLPMAALRPEARRCFLLMTFGRRFQTLYETTGRSRRKLRNAAVNGWAVPITWRGAH